MPRLPADRVLAGVVVELCDKLIDNWHPATWRHERLRLLNVAGCRPDTEIADQV